MYTHYNMWADRYYVMCKHYATKFYFPQKTAVDYLYRLNIFSSFLDDIIV